MYKSLKQAWITALRSGKYKQIKELMTDHAGGFCAMGVLAEVYAQQVGVDFWDAVMTIGETGICPVPDKTFATIARLNDENITFATIANILEFEYDDSCNLITGVRELIAA